MATRKYVIITRALLWAFILNEIYACEEDFEEENCTLTAFCMDSIQSGHLYQGILYRNNPEYSYSQCSSNYNGQNKISIHLTITNMLGDIDDYQNYNADSIETLSLENYDFGTIPMIRLSSHLKLLNVSHGKLQEVKLSNANELQSLLTLDLSYNIISSIYYDEDQYIFSNLQRLDLSHNQLESIPDAIFHPLNELISLDLSWNNINQINMLTFEGLKKLKYLFISNNKLTDINGSFFRFSNLIELNLSNNKLTDIYTKDFENLNMLEQLDLHMNSITTLKSHYFQNTVNLKSLDLSHNCLVTIEKYTFRNISLLMTIDLSYNNINFLKTDLFKLKEIVNFNIEHNYLQGSLVRGMFEGLKFVTELDLSHQNLTSIEDFAFIGLDTISSLLINNNYLNLLAKDCLSGINNLKTLDLSFNKLIYIDFNKESLQNLISLQLRNNKISKVYENTFKYMNRLQFIDLSNNNLVSIEAHAFTNLRDLIQLEISQNPLQGELAGKTFDGLNYLPTLDISNTKFTSIKNLSFYGMEILKDINISHSSIDAIEYNAFLQTGSVEILDLSHNKLELFHINATDLRNLKVLILSFNYLETIYTDTFMSFFLIRELFLNNNRINKIEDNALDDLSNLNKLDLSFNQKHLFSTSSIRKLPRLNSLHISDLSPNVSFSGCDNFTLIDLQITNSEMQVIKYLKLPSLKQLETLKLSYDKIINVSAIDFMGMKKIKNLDLSANNIIFLQPGSFKDNDQLLFLNISHNTLSKIGYGVFLGLVSLHTIDMSYNNIDTLQFGGFAELVNLKVLIVDHNRIKSFYPEDFSYINLNLLSIGENPIPCETLSNLKERRHTFEITSINKNVYSHENVNGVTCNVDKHIPSTIAPYNTSIGSERILLSIRDILFNISLSKGQPSENNNTFLLNEINNQLNEVNVGIKNITDQVQEKKMFNSVNNLTNIMSYKINESNSYLQKILKLLSSSNSIRTAPPIILTKENTSFESILSYVNKLNTQLENKYEIDQRNIDVRINLLEKKFDNYQNEASALVTENIPPAPVTISEQSLIFTEVCVCLILIIVITFALVKMYKSRQLFNSRRSISTRQIVESMENSNL